MPKNFNVTGTCIPDKHYMVDVKDLAGRKAHQRGLRQ